MYQELKEVWQELTAEGAPFHVTETEVNGNRIKTFSQAPPSLREIWLASLGHGERDYLVYQDERWTYGQAHQETAALAAWLHRNNVGAGKRVAIAMRNYPEWLMAYWAVVSTGATAVGMNAWWIEHEMTYALDDAKPDVLILDQERLDRFHNIRDGFPDMTVVGVRLQQSRDYVIPWAEVVGEGGDLPDVSIDPDDDAVIFYTSGTTGNPKGAIQTHRGCVANVLNIAFWGNASAMAAARANGEEMPDNAQPADISALVTTPLFHVTANNCLAHAATVAGGKLVLMYKWDASEALKMIERERITNLTGVPMMSRELISHPDFHKYDTSSLTSVGGGGAQLQPDLVNKIDSSVETARPGTGYGMTETCGIITTISADYFVDKPDSAGPAMPTFDVICVDADGNELPQGEIGEICVKGAPVIKGYLNKPEATRETIVDGWLHTGDMGWIDQDGFIFIVDRIKDMVIRGGENIYCAEVETVIFKMDEVAECIVFGVEDTRLGEEVGAAVVAKGDARLTADAIREHCLKHLAKHKIPRYIWFLDDPLPRNANGKFLKREVREVLDVSDAA